METDNIPRSAEIRWTLEPIARLEDVNAEDLLALDPGELLSYVQDCREDLRAVRETLREAIALVALQRDQLARAARIVEFQRQQIREQRDRAAA